MSESVDGLPIRLTTPRPADLGLRRICSDSGLEISLLPNGGLFAIEHVGQCGPVGQGRHSGQGGHGGQAGEAGRGGRTMINRVLGSPLAGGMGRLCLRVGSIAGTEPLNIPLAGADAHSRIGAAGESLVWEGETSGLCHSVALHLDRRRSLWRWQVEVRNDAGVGLPCDSILIQDLGLGDRAFLMSNEAYASQYIDHYIAVHRQIGHVLMARQNLPQNGRHPWVVHGCVQGTVGYATDFRQVMGPAYRDGAEAGPPFGTCLPSMRLQHEVACSALQSASVELAPGATAGWTFFALYAADHPAASSDGDLALVDEVLGLQVPRRRRTLELRPAARSVLQDAQPVIAEPLDEAELHRRCPHRRHLERVAGQVLSLFTGEGAHSRHIVLREKERRVLRRHGSVLRSGSAMLPEETTLCVTCWMHGIFGAQLALGNTSFHRLFSVSRDPYNIGRGTGLRILVDIGHGWRLLAVPSAFEIGLADCRWIYRLGGELNSAGSARSTPPGDSEQVGSLLVEGALTHTTRTSDVSARTIDVPAHTIDIPERTVQVSARTIEVSASVSPDEPAAAWRLVVEGPPCRFLVFAHLALGEREFEQAARVEVDPSGKRFEFRPDPDGLWGRHYPHAVYHLVTSTPDSIEIAGADELLYADGGRRSGAYVALRTVPTREIAFAVVGALSDPDAASLAARYSAHVDEATMRSRATRYWEDLTRGLRICGIDREGADRRAADPEDAEPAEREDAEGADRENPQGADRDADRENPQGADRDADRENPQGADRNADRDADREGVEALATILPWLAHDAMVHLTVPQGLEQYSGAAWGTRDVCQGPIELLLALGHDAPAAAILRRLFKEQSAADGDWPQWFMLEPYSEIRDQTAHGDVIIWPLKALCDYVEATGDMAILAEKVPWRGEESLRSRSEGGSPAHHIEGGSLAHHIEGGSLAHHLEGDSVAHHIERLIDTVRARLVPGTQLLRYGNGDWNDSLQPVDPSMRERMVSSWTVALLYEQLVRYAAILRRTGRSNGTAESDLAEGMRADFNRYLLRDGVVAGYGVFGSATAAPELLFHPSDRRTGISYSLLPMTQAIIGGLFTSEQAQRHLRLIREHLSFPDGVRLMDRPISYHGGPQTLFQRAESAAFFGREIGLMYTHAHLRYAQAMAVLGHARELWEALLIANPIAVTERLAHATLRQRNTYFSSSDAAFADRYEASGEWARVRARTVDVDGGWRMYSSGPGIYTNLLICQAFGRRRRFGAPILEPCLPRELRQLTLRWREWPASDSRRQ